MTVVEEPLESWLKTFEESGGVVVRLEASFSGHQLISLFPESVTPQLPLRAIQGSDEKLQIVTRKGEGRTIWFIINTGTERLEVEFSPDSGLREIPLDGNLPAILTRTNNTYRRTIYPFESFLLEATEEPETACIPEKITIPVNQPSRISLGNKNLLRMYKWEMDLLDENGQSLQSAMVPAIPLPNQLAHGGFRFAPKISTFFGAAPRLSLPTLDLRYRFRFECNFTGSVELVMEPESIVGQWDMKINDSEPITASEFGVTDAHVRGSFGLDITPYMRSGSNRIDIHLKTDKIDGGLVNPLYLAGDFGVKLDPVELVEPYLNGGFEEWEENGLPYFAGMVEYKTSFHLETVPDGDNVMIEIDHRVPFQDATEVSINEGSSCPMSWSPYRSLMPTSELRAGNNVMNIRVYTTLIRSFEGQWFDMENHCCREVGS